ncbi:MAG: Uma2 family endonuclease [Desulfobacterales bacterium]|nr:Uma2 family endonuclease [Desulfobacterales bacterium]
MSLPAEREVCYDDLYSIPNSMIGQIIDGDLIAMPRPTYRHSNVVSALEDEIGPSYRRGRNGPGGWIILFEPEIQFGKNILVPDLAGWKKEHLPSPPETNWCEVSPDWVCEVLSPSTIRIDRIKKMNIYAAYNVPYVWLIHPIDKTFEVFKLEHGRWILLSIHGENDKVRAEPFQEVEIDLNTLWWD